MEFQFYGFRCKISNPKYVLDNLEYFKEFIQKKFIKGLQHCFRCYKWSDEFCECYKYSSNEITLPKCPFQFYCWRNSIVSTDYTDNQYVVKKKDGTNFVGHIFGELLCTIDFSIKDKI
jgi:hypothetical protein